MILDEIPHLAQVGPGADRSRNDCGPACVAMVVSGLVRPLTVDQSSIDCGQALNQYTGFSHIMRGLKKHGLDYAMRNQFQPAGKIFTGGIRDEIRKGNPVILLVHYDGLPYKKQDTNFHGWHFVVAVGFTAVEIVINDPLFWGSRADEGVRIHVADKDIEKAMSFNPQNYPHQGLVVVNPEPVQPEPGGDDTAVDLDVEDFIVLAKALREALTAVGEAIKAVQATSEPIERALGVIDDGLDRFGV